MESALAHEQKNKRQKTRENNWTLKIESERGDFAWWAAPRFLPTANSLQIRWSRQIWHTSGIVPSILPTQTHYPYWPILVAKYPNTESKDLRSPTQVRPIRRTEEEQSIYGAPYRPKSQSVSLAIFCRSDCVDFIFVFVENQNEVTTRSWSPFSTYWSVALPLQVSRPQTTTYRENTWLRRP